MELDIGLKSTIKEAIRRWVDDSSGLLDHVYFETEPMITARRKEILDFSKASSPAAEPEVKMRRLPKEKLHKAREAVDRLASKYRDACARLPLQGPPDAEFEEWMRSVEGKDLETGLTGKASLADDLEDEPQTPNKE